MSESNVTYVIFKYEEYKSKAGMQLNKNKKKQKRLFFLYNGTFLLLKYSGIM